MTKDQKDFHFRFVKDCLRLRELLFFVPVKTVLLRSDTPDRVCDVLQTVPGMGDVRCLVVGRSRFGVVVNTVDFTRVCKVYEGPPGPLGSTLRECSRRCADVGGWEGTGLLERLNRSPRRGTREPGTE